MRLWIVETRAANPGGHELELDRILVEELTGLGHRASLALPVDYGHEFDWRPEVVRLESRAAPLPERGFFGRIRRSVLSETRRHRLFAEVLDRSGEYDAVVFPSMTHRFLRSLKSSALRRSAKPVVFLGYEVQPEFNDLMAKYLGSLPKPNKIKLLMTVIRPEAGDYGLANYRLAPPPAYVPRDVPWRPAPAEGPLVLGCFGQYRREKNLGGLLDAILGARLDREVKFVIQAMGATERERAEVSELVEAYSGRDPRLVFLTGVLPGAKWQEALLDVHAILLPYAAPRFRWTWSSMVFSAIGYRRPILATGHLNPAVTERFAIGRVCRHGDMGSLVEGLEGLVGDFGDPEAYRSGLEAAFEYYHPRRLAERLVEAIESD